METQHNQAREGRLLFVNKKKQKNFDYSPAWNLAAALPQPRDSGAKVFWFWRPDDGAAEPRHPNRAEAPKGARKDSKKTISCF